MKIFIEAITVKSGGGLVHLRNLISALTVKFETEIVLLTNEKAAASIEPTERLNLILVRENFLFSRLDLIFFLLGGYSKKVNSADVFLALSPFVARFTYIPKILLPQNALPFSLIEARRWGLLSPMYLKLSFLGFLMKKFLSRADGVIYLSEFAKDLISPFGGEKHMVIPHGIQSDFYTSSLIENRDLDQNAFCLKYLYVSPIMPYKHQIAVVKAFEALISDGYNVEIEFVGRAFGYYGRRFKNLIERINSDRIKYTSEVAYSDMPKIYFDSDLLLFASTCENLPNIVLEAMAAGLPILSAKSRPMIDILGNSAVYFDPLNISSIKSAVLDSLENLDNLKEKAREAQELSLNFSWERNAFETYQFLQSFT